MSPQPFDKEKYQRLMDGLECSEILASELDNLQYRLDAEFYKKINLQTEKCIMAQFHKNIESMNVTLDCSAFYPSVVDIYNFSGNGIPFIRVNEITSLGMTTITDTTAFLPKKFLNKNQSTIARCSPEDIIIAKEGNTLAKAGILCNDYKEYATCRDIVVLRTQHIKKMLRYYLWAYLQSSYGQTLLWRTASQTGQPHLTIEYIKAMKIPLFRDEIYEQIQTFYQKSHTIDRKAHVAYQEAESLLLSSLHLDTFTPSINNTSVKTFSQIAESGRMDAEYYQEKYDEILKVIENSKNNPSVKKVSPLGKIVDIKKSIEPGSDEYLEEGIPFIRVADVSKYELQPPKIFLNKHTFDIDELKPKQNTILLSKDGTVGIAYKIERDMDAITSGALLHLSVIDEQTDPDYLTLLLNSFLVSMQAERDVGGSVLKHWRIDEIKKVQLPILQTSIQQIISHKIRKSFALREQSKSLLKAAVRAVEIAIEQDESAAIAYLKKQTEGDA